jgi:hypothetical protein
MLLMLATAATALASGLSHTYCYKKELTASLPMPLQTEFRTSAHLVKKQDYLGAAISEK